MSDERLVESPRNAVQPPPGKDRKFGQAVRRPVIARLVWRSATWYVPATVVWVSDDRVCVLWQPHPATSTSERHTWLPKQDVRGKLVYRA